jgi:hypothetical protein
MNFHIGLPQGIYITINHGKSRKPYNVWERLIAEIIIVSLLIWGGFFR